MNRPVQITCYLSFILAFSYVIIRGFTVGMTHDEALTYKIINGDQDLINTANHHWLNTHLSAFSSMLFGAKEFALRLPNILSFIIFWIFIYRISRNFLTSSYTQIALVLFLCGNPFILDFFSLSRGYGLSIAFVTASLFYLFTVFKSGRNSQPIHYLAGTVFAVLALSANLNTLNYFLIALALLLTGLVLFRIKNWLLVFGIIVILSGITLYFSLDRLFFLKNQKELYFGTGNLNTSIDNLICSSLYVRDGFKEVIILRYFFYGLFVLTGFLVIRKNQQFNPGSIAFVVILSILAALIAEHFLFDALYPINRSSLYLYPVILLAFLLNADRLRSRLLRIPLLVCSLLFISACIPAYNFERTMTWPEDSHIKEAMLLIKKDIKDDAVHIAECTWIYEPVINYYRLEYQVPVQEVFRDGIKYEGEYLLIQNESKVNKNYKLLLTDKSSGMQVFKRKTIAAN